MDLGEIGWGVVDWIDLAQDRDKWRSLEIQEGSLVATQPLASRVVLNSIELVS
jgi:hypothetical protein